jgi:hypothetical protein
MATENLSNSEKMDELLDLTRENNELLHDLRGRARWALVFRVIYWSLILASVFGVYYYLQPYTDSIKANFGMFKDLLDKANTSGYNFSEMENVKGFFESFKNSN